MPQAHLLALPRELRDIILGLVSFTPAPTFSPPEEKRTAHRDVEYTHWLRGVHVEYTNNPQYFYNSSPLLAVNRQLRAETLDLLRSPAHRRFFAFDIALKHQKLLPTWTTVPDLSISRYNHVYATVRVPNPDWQWHWPFMGGGPTGVPSITWSLYCLLERFLKVGPAGEQPHPDDEHEVPGLSSASSVSSAESTSSESSYPDRKISIDTLDLDVLTRAQERDPNLRHSLAPSCMPWSFQRRLSKTLAAFRDRQDKLSSSSSSSGSASDSESSSHRLVLHPDFLVGFLMTSIDYFVKQRSRNAGDLLYERVGRIRILLNGELVHEFNLAQLMQTNSFNYSPEVYAMWKTAMVEKRKKMGLPVVDVNVDHPEPESAKAKAPTVDNFAHWIGNDPVIVDDDWHALHQGDS